MVTTSNPAPGISPENNSTDQDYTIDINKIYIDWIGSIDAIRSFANINGNPDIITNLSVNNLDPTGIVKLATLEKTPQESRCHAFFRLIGFPVVNSDQSNYYSPGFDIIYPSKNNPRKLTIDEKIGIAKKPITGFNALSLTRELFAQSNFQIFSNPTLVTAGILALSSGGTQTLSRQFITPLNNFKSFEVIINSYTADTNGIVGDGTNGYAPLVPLDKYQDANGLTNTSSAVSPISFKRSHIIAPFIVDARLDLTVSPQANLIAVPFVPDESYTKVSITQNVKRPLIEKIIRDRTSTSNTAATLGTSINDIFDFIKKTNTVNNPNLNKLTSIPQNSYLNDQDKFINTVYTIETMMHELIIATDIIKQAQATYYWLPAPSTIGPEGGSDVQGVFLPTKNGFSQALTTQQDSDIIIALANSITSNINTETATINGTPDVGSYGGPPTTTTFAQDTTSALNSNNQQQLTTATTQRTRLLSKANDALRTIEIIMGEFSGFGLCDIIAIMGALNFISIASLIGLLDSDAQTRMIAVLKGQSTLPAANSLSASIQELTSTVTDFYALMDSIYTDFRDKSQ